MNLTVKSTECSTKSVVATEQIYYEFNSALRSIYKG